MKTFCRLGLAAALLLSVSACYVTSHQAGSQGDLQVALDRSLTSNPSATQARVWLLAGNNRIRIGDGEDYVAVGLADFSGDTVTLSGIPAGYEYVVMFSVGIDHGSWFEVLGWGESNPVTVVAGVDTDVALAKLSTTGSPFTLGSAAVRGLNMKDVAVNGATVYAADATRLYSGATAAGLAAVGAALPGSREINSLSINTTFLGPVWVNTTHGIVGYNGAYSVSAALTLDIASVLDSGGYVDTSARQYIWLQRDGGLAGHRVDLPWIDVDVSDLVSGQPVKDLVVVDSPSDALDWGYFATQLGGFALDRTMLNDGSPDFLTYAGFFKDIEGGGAQHFVTSLGYDGTSFTMGTAAGAYTSSNPVTTAGTLVPGTGGHAFTEIEAGGAGDVAMLTQNYLFVRHGGATRRFPFCAGLPGSVTGLAWRGTTLEISGTQGVVELDTAGAAFAQGLLVP